MILGLSVDHLEAMPTSVPLPVEVIVYRHFLGVHCIAVSLRISRLEGKALLLAVLSSFVSRASFLALMSKLS